MLIQLGLFNLIANLVLMTQQPQEIKPLLILYGGYNINITILKRNRW